jgi:glycerol-3-phosphate acyltransferase PlsY
VTALILAFLFAYLLGSIPFGLLVARLAKGIDIRQYGSRNIGATNVFRVVGKKWGITVFFLDVLKGYWAVQFPIIFLSKAGSPISIAFGILAIFGHSFPVWLGFRGGKGVATSLGVFLAIVPQPALLAFGAWGVVFALTRILSIASLAAAVFFPVILFLTYRHQELFPWIFPVSLLLAGFIFYTHRTNIQRLFRGEEKKLF